MLIGAQAINYIELVYTLSNMERPNFYLLIILARSNTFAVLSLILIDFLLIKIQFLQVYHSFLNFVFEN
jgi:hypothetical protein